MVNPNQLNILKKGRIRNKPPVEDDKYVLQREMYKVYYIRTENGASYEIVIATVNTYQHKNTGDYVHDLKDQREITTFEDEIKTDYTDDGHYITTVGNIPPLNIGIKNGGDVYITTELEKFGFTP